MATYVHTYQPTGYQTDAYGRPVPENYYAMSTPQPLYPAPPIKHYPTLVPRYWALDQNQVPYGPFISQGIPQDWRRNSLQATARTHQRVLPGGHSDLSGTLEQWANHLLEFHELYQHGSIPESTQNTLQVDLHLLDKLHALVDEIHTSPTPRHFEDPVDPARSFHVQRKEPTKPQDPVPTLVPRQQEELNAASNILKALNPTRGLFDQPATRTIGLLAYPHANSLPSAFRMWGQPADTNLCPDALPQPLPTDNDNASTHTLSYINELEALSSGSAPPGGAPTSEFQRNRPPHFDLCHPCSNTLPPRNNPPPLQQPAAPGAPRPPPF
ncbi:hypothetical protein C0993_008860 [Termitomyces sp. T159_Od127]|nr:hypothetical protein C0993_008860 [Termitomyces sp. T159_Od127]